jgi:hypothetical protein
MLFYFITTLTSSPYKQSIHFARIRMDMYLSAYLDIADAVDEGGYDLAPDTHLGAVNQVAVVAEPAYQTQTRHSRDYT